MFKIERKVRKMSFSRNLDPHFSVKKGVLKLQNELILKQKKGSFFIIFTRQNYPYLDEILMIKHIEIEAE
jgi:hypothetical protein